jgi:hypothetical protein
MRLFFRQKTHLLTKFFRRPLADQVLFLEATFWLGISRLALLILPFRWIAPFLGQHMVSSEDHMAPKGETPLSVSRAILTMSRHLPWECKCLSQAISAKMMLGRRQISSTLYLGVAKEGKLELIAHAWLRAGGKVLIGNGDLERFAVVSIFT